MARVDRLRMPSLPEPLIRRHRLTRAILSTAPAHCCLIAAPRGYGATTVVGDALRDSAEAAVQVALPSGAGPADALLRVRDVIEVHGRGDGSPGWLVVHGLQRHHGEAWEELAGLGRRLPPDLRLIVCTVHRPPVEWSVLASENGSVYLDSEALAFTTDEAVRLLQAWKDGIGLPTLTAVVEDAQGWVAALAAAGARARQGRMDRAWLRGTGAAQLFGPWLADLPGRLREALIATSVLDLLSADLVSAVLDDPAAADDLLALDGMLGYITEVEPPGNHAGRWWKRHPLLTAALLQHSGPQRRAHHSRAAEWFAEHGDFHSTMKHLVQAGRAGDASDFLMHHQRQLFAAGRARDVLDLYLLLPGGWGSRAQNMLLLGWGQVLSGDTDSAGLTVAALEADLLAAAGQYEPPVGDPNLASRELLVAQIDLLRAFLASYHADVRTMVESGQRATDVLRHHEPTEAQQLAWITVLRGLLWSARLDAARQLGRRLWNEPFPNEVIREGTLIPVQAVLSAVDGDVRGAASLVARTRSWFAGQGMDPLAQPHYDAVSAAAMVACETGDPRTAIDLTTSLEQRAAQQRMRGEQVAALTLRARCHWALGDFAAAAADLAAARSVAVEASPGSAMLGTVGLAQVTLHMASGDLVRAERVLDALPRGIDWDLSKAATMLVSQPAAAVRALEAMNPTTPRTRCIRHMLLATGLVGSSRLLAQRHLRAAAAVAQEFGMALLLAETAPVLVQLAAQTAVEAQDDALRWALGERDRFLANLRAGSPAGRESPQPLSRGELALIALLPSRAGNAELAATLGVSVNTVKTRLRRLYAKLGVGSRDQAIARAEQRGLIPPSGSRL